MSVPRVPSVLRLLRRRSIDAGVRAEFDLPPVRKEWTVEQKLTGWDETQAK